VRPVAGAAVAFLVLLAGVGGVLLLKRWEGGPQPAGWVVSPADRDAYLKDPARVNAQIQLRPEFGKEPHRVERLVVGHVAPDSPAHAAGVRSGDVVVSINGKPVTTMERARSLMHEIRGAASLDVRLDRAGTPLEVRVDFR